MAWAMRDQTAIVGIGETEYRRWGQIDRAEFSLACEAILKALDDAGLTVDDLDGFSSYSNDRNDPAALANALGVPQVRFSNMFWGGGGGGYAGAVMNAMTAVYSGVANCVVAYRSLCQGQFGRFGQSRGPNIASGASAFQVPFGWMSAPGNYAMRARRYMTEYGITSRQFGNIAVAAYKHAQRNPRAVMYGRPITIEDHQNSRFIVDPLKLYDCCQENDGACAVIVVSAERAKDLKQRPVYIMAGAQGSGFRAAGAAGNRPDFVSSTFTTVARDLYARAGIGPKDVDVAQIYENFTPMAMMSIEEHGFCKRGEGGAFCEDGNIEWPNGGLPINTSGGNLAEAYIHGFEFVAEATRQMRGTSTAQVEGAEICLCAGGPGVDTVSDLIVRR
ncbi:MAG: acetyl-CoA acetyltransferase [Chloroflexi bacterium]|nr:acetyl-CoA acetyltransferase [Chloroflexota bacterium]